MFIDIRMSCKLTGKVQMNMAASFDMQQLSPSMPGNRPLGQANTWCDSSFILFGSILLPSMRFRFTHWSKPLNPAATHEAKGFGCAVFFAGKKNVYYIYIYYHMQQIWRGCFPRLVVSLFSMPGEGDAEVSKTASATAEDTETVTKTFGLQLEHGQRLVLRVWSMDFLINQINQ